jgi:class 3 adenylate cyclase
MASRLETLTKQLGRSVLLSRAFADFVESDFDLERVGEYPVRGSTTQSSCLRIAAEAIYRQIPLPATLFISRGYLYRPEAGIK